MVNLLNKGVTMKNFNAVDMSISEKVLFNLVTHNITPRNQRNHIVNAWDVRLMFALKTKKKIDLPAMILLTLDESRQVNQGLVHGGVVTAALIESGVDTDRFYECARTAQDCICYEMLSKMGIKTNGDKLVAIQKPTKSEYARSEPRPMARASGIKRRRSLSPVHNRSGTSLDTSTRDVLQRVRVTLTVVQAISTEPSVHHMVQGEIDFIDSHIA